MGRHGRPEIFNTDQGVQFTSAAFLDELSSERVRISMDGKGRFLDNIFIERLWRSLKHEEVYIKAYGSVAETRQGIRGWLAFYNEKRPHQALGYRTPRAVYEGAALSMWTALPHRYATFPGRRESDRGDVAPPAGPTPAPRILPLQPCFQLVMECDGTPRCQISPNGFPAAQCRAAVSSTMAAEHRRGIERNRRRTAAVTKYTRRIPEAPQPPGMRSRPRQHSG
jgi:Integrase core domain